MEVKEWCVADFLFLLQNLEVDKNDKISGPELQTLQDPVEKTRFPGSWRPRLYQRLGDGQPHVFLLPGQVQPLSLLQHIPINYPSTINIHLRHDRFLLSDGIFMSMELPSSITSNIAIY